MADTIDINVYETTEDVTINVTPNVIEVNINKVTSIGAVSSVNGQTGDVVLTTSDLTNDSNFVSDASYVHTDNNYTTTEKLKLAGIQSGAEVNVNADWNATSGDALILNKPTIPTSLPPNGTAGGDLQGTYPNPTVHQIQGQAVQNGSPADGDILTWDNTASMWKHLQLASTKVISALGYTPENVANKSTSTADSASTTKFPVWSAIVSYFDSSRLKTILGVSVLSGSNTGDQDLSGLALKQMGAYSMRVNNTNATANATETNFQQIGKTTYSGTITWTGTTAPSGTNNFTYNFIRIGNIVFFNITLVYGNPGTSNSQVLITLTSDFPTPIKPDGLPNGGNLLYQLNGRIGSAESSTITTGLDVVLRSNSSNNGFEIIITQTALNAKVVRVTGQYFTA